MEVTVIGGWCFMESTQDIIVRKLNFWTICRSILYNIMQFVIITNFLIDFTGRMSWIYSGLPMDRFLFLVLWITLVSYGMFAKVTSCEWPRTQVDVCLFELLTKLSSISMKRLGITILLLVCKSILGIEYMFSNYLLFKFLYLCLHLRSFWLCSLSYKRFMLYLFTTIHFVEVCHGYWFVLFVMHIFRVSSSNSWFSSALCPRSGLGSSRPLCGFFKFW